MKSRQGSGTQSGWRRVLLGSAAGLLGALVGRKLGRRSPVAASEDVRSSLDERPSPEAVRAVETMAPKRPRVRRGPNGREHYEWLSPEVAAAPL
jgi:hypothetical protein